jgi:predicted GNAT family N-acyltransferase
MPVQGKYLYYGDDLSEAFQIRKEVFQEEQGVSEKEEFDEIDDLAIHVVVYSNDDLNKAVATGRVFFDGNDYYIGRIAVLKDERGKNYGDFAVRMLANKAFLAGANEILIHAQVSAVPFYEKIGFITYGDEFMEAGINHISMKLVAGSLCKKCDNKIKD